MSFDQSIAAPTRPCEFVCVECSSPLVQPLEWERHQGVWTVHVRCPECGKYGQLHMSEDQAVIFQNLQEDAVHSMVQTAEMLDLEAFREACTTFVRALRADLIDPVDFQLPNSAPR